MKILFLWINIKHLLWNLLNEQIKNVENLLALLHRRNKMPKITIYFLKKFYLGIYNDEFLFELSLGFINIIIEK